MRSSAIALTSIAVLCLVLGSAHTAVAKDADLTFYTFNVDVYVYDLGTVFVNGLSDLPVSFWNVGSSQVYWNSTTGYLIANTNDLTWKEGGNWSFRLLVNNSYTEGQIRVLLPDGARVTGVEVRAGADYSIYHDGDINAMVVEAHYYDLNPDINVSYVLTDSGDSGNLMLVIVVVTLCVGLVGSLYAMNKRKSPYYVPVSKISHEKLDVVMSTLSEKEREIMEAITDEGGIISQSKLRHKTGISKATLSRTVDRLALKKLIEKVAYGNTNKLKLHPSFWND